MLTEESSLGTVSEPSRRVLSRLVGLTLIPASAGCKNEAGSTASEAVYAAA